MAAATVLETLGPRFSGTLIEDPALEPFFITADQGGGYTIHKKRVDSKGQLKFSDICYPGTIETCLLRIIKEKLNEPGKAFDTLDKYFQRANEIAQEIRVALENRGYSL